MMEKNRGSRFVHGSEGLSGKKVSQRESPSGGFDRWKKDLGLMVLLYVLILFLYRDLVFFGKIYVSADNISQGAVFGKFWFEQFGTHHRYPLWYPHIFSGMPLFASMIFVRFAYFPRFILYYLDQLGFHFLHLKIVHFFLGGLFTYLVMRSYKLHRSSSFVAATIFIFIPMVASLEHNTRIITITYIPVIFYLIKRLCERRDVTSFAWASLAIGFQMLANHLQIVYYTWLFLGLYFLGRVISHLQKKSSFRHALHEGGLLLGSLIIGIGMASFLVLSIYEYASYSARGSGDPVAAYNFATNWSLHPKEMVTLVIPSFMGFGGQTYWGYMPFTHCANYIGIVALFLAVWALVYRRSRQTVFFAVVGGLAILVSFGRFFPLLYKPMYHLLPFFNKFRLPAMILMLLFFCVAMLAGFGVQALMEMGSNSASRRGLKSWKRLSRKLFLLAVALVVLGVFFSLAQGPISRSLKATYERADAAQGRHPQISLQVRDQLDSHRFTMVFRDTWKMLLFLAAASLLTALYLSGKASRRLFIGLLTTLVLADFFWVDLGLIRYDQDRDFLKAYYRSQEDEAIRFLQRDHSLFRILPLDEANTNKYGYFGISSVGGYHAAKLGLYQEVMEKVGFGNPNVLDLLNVKYLITRRLIEHPRFELMLQTSSGNIYRNRGVMPRVFTVNQLEVLEQKEEALARLASPEFDPRKVAILENPPPFSLDPGGGGTVEVVSYESEAIQLEANITAACMLVLSEVYYPAGWKAYVDGRETMIYKADYLLRAIHLPPGDHRVTFLFRPWTFKAGLWISIVFLLGILVTLVFARLRSSKNHPSG